MLINARDPRQWTYLRNFPKKKKKTMVLTNVGKRAVWGVLHTRRKRVKKNPDINQCGEKGGGGYYISVGKGWLGGERGITYLLVL
jgi:hypothetical protein